MSEHRKDKEEGPSSMSWFDRTKDEEGRVAVKPSESTTKIKVSEPTPFDGNPIRFNAFFRQIQLHLTSRKISDDTDKIIATLSYMKDGTAGEWSDMMTVMIFDSDPPRFPSWKDFVKLLTDHFQDRVATQTARQKLENYEQSAGIDEHIQTLESLFVKAGLTDEGERIRLLEQSIDGGLITMIYNNPEGKLLKMYIEYINLLKNIGHLRKKRRFQVKIKSTSKTPPSPPPPKPSTSSTPWKTETWMPKKKESGNIAL